MVPTDIYDFTVSKKFENIYWSDNSVTEFLYQSFIITAVILGTL